MAALTGKVQQALPRLRDQRRIVNVSTGFTHGGHNPDVVAYAMSKAAIDPARWVTGQWIDAGGGSLL